MTEFKEKLKIKLEENGLQWKYDFTELLLNDIEKLFLDTFLKVASGERLEALFTLMPDNGDLIKKELKESFAKEISIKI